MQDFKNIRAWHAAHELEMDVFRHCDPKLFARYPGLRSQTLRTANSIVSNISEGAAKEGAEFARYLGISVAATNELENHLNSAWEAELIATATFSRLVDKADLVRRMLIRLIQSIRAATSQRR